MAQAPARRRSRLVIVLALGLLAVLALFALARSGRGGAQDADRRVLLFTTLPILWAETARLGDALNPDAPPHWALGVLREAGEVRAVDALATDDGSAAIGEADLLVMAQPRALSADENVALDAWVRAGGRVLLFVDPMLTAESAYAIGDPRRAQDIAMLSPILRHWGLELTFDEGQAPGERIAQVVGGPVPVNLAGQFARTGAAARTCAIRDAGLAARCVIGKGTVLAVADAAVLESGAASGTTARREALHRLVAEAGS